MKMRYMCAAVLSLMLVACSDDSTSNVLGENHLGLFGGKSVRLGECLGSPYDDFIEGRVLAKDAEDVTPGEMPKAYIVQDSAGNEQVMILKVSDYCGVGADLNYRRSGDTLTIAYGEIHEATSCMCYSDHWFGLPAEYSDIKYFRFDGIVYEVDRGPAPEPSKPKESEPIDTPPAEYDPETGDSVVVMDL